MRFLWSQIAWGSRLCPWIFLNNVQKKVINIRVPRNGYSKETGTPTLKYKRLATLYHNLFTRRFNQLPWTSRQQVESNKAEIMFSNSKRVRFGHVKAQRIIAPDYLATEWCPDGWDVVSLEQGHAVGDTVWGTTWARPCLPIPLPRELSECCGRQRSTT